MNNNLEYMLEWAIISYEGRKCWVTMKTFKTYEEAQNMLAEVTENNVDKKFRITIDCTGVEV